MKAFMDENFLLKNETAVALFHNYAKDMPIFDYHCHLNVKEIAEDRKYENITQVWLGGDHYKWRALRTNGVEEKYITGDADDKVKFMKWAETMPYCIGNPLYHWTHLELKRYFGINKQLDANTAEEIWNTCNKILQNADFSARGLIKNSNVKAVCTTDDPVDSLEYHQQIDADTTFDVKVLPAFRPGDVLGIEKEGFNAYMGKLARASGVEINTFDDLKAALKRRLEHFHAVGCRISDHALDPVVFVDSSLAEVAAIFAKRRKGSNLTEEEEKKFKTQIMIFLGREYAQMGWVMQLHIGTIRNNSSRMMQQLGPDTGFDAIGDSNFALELSKLLDALDQTGELPKTILYCLNPRDNEVLGTMIGCFQGGGIPGKIQFGSGWWFNDQKDGMTKQMVALANLGLLSRFVGMLTDSRSFLSYTRHEYFRRILCNLIGEWVENGEYPCNMEMLGCIVQDICFTNAKNYFGIEL